MLTSQPSSDAKFSIPREASIVMAMRKTPADKVPRKARYHHGELREALIEATRQLVVERGAEKFYARRRLPGGWRHHRGALPALPRQAGDPRGDRLTRF